MQQNFKIFLRFSRVCIELWSARLSQHKNVHIISLTDARALHADSRNHTKKGSILVEMILLVKNLLTVIAADFALQIIVSIIDNAIRITFDIHAIIRVLSSIRIFSSAFYPPSAFYLPSAFSHPYFLIRIRHPYPRFISTSSGNSSCPLVKTLYK